MFILECIFGLKSQSVHFYNEIAQADIPKVKDLYIELPTYFTCGIGKDMIFKNNNNSMGKQ